MDKNRCVFLDRDGVLNEEIGRHVVKAEEFVVKKGVSEGLKKLKEAGFLLIVITNQSGVARGYYGEDFVLECHQRLQEVCGHVLDDLYYAPGLDEVSKTLSRKPDSLMIERAMAKYNIDPAQSWMVGDKKRDLIPARKWGVGTIHLTQSAIWEHADVHCPDFSQVVEHILAVN